MDISKIKIVAMDLDGTLSQHKSPLPKENIEMLNKLAKKYKLLMVGAGMCRRIFNQMDHYPVDILGNYGLQYAEYNQKTKDIDILTDIVVPCDEPSVDARVTTLRQETGYTTFAGENTEFHASGCVTIPMLGTKANPAEKLAFDPDRSKRRAFYGRVKELFPEYNVVVGGSSSFDMVPAPYSKFYALNKYAQEHNIALDEIVYIGDDYGPGGNDESVYLSPIPYLTIDNFNDFPKVASVLL